MQHVTPVILFSLTFSIFFLFFFFFFKLLPVKHYFTAIIENYSLTFALLIQTTSLTFSKG
jgi:hypothetical protein